MVWPKEFTLLKFFLQSRLVISWIVFAAGILAAVLLHRKDKKCRIWPVIPAVVLWLACEVAETNVQGYGINFVAFVVATFAAAYAVGWLVMDIVYLVRKAGERENRVRRSTVVIALVMLVIAAAFIAACSTKHRSTLDLNGLENISSLPMDGAFTLDGKQYLPHLNIYGSNFDRLMKELNVSSPEEIGKVVAFRYTPNGSACYYYCTVDALPGDWLLMFQDDRTGVPSAKNALTLFGTQASIDNAPNWLKAGQ